MYVFPSPERPGALALALNAFPFAGPTARYSDVVDYRLRIRPVTVASATFAVSDTEFTFSCRFTAPVDCYARYVIDDEWAQMEAGTLGNDINDPYTNSLGGVHADAMERTLVVMEQPDRVAYVSVRAP